jgi:hypothetical protein
VEWVRRDAIVRLTLAEEEPGILLGGATPDAGNPCHQGDAPGVDQTRD